MAQLVVDIGNSVIKAFVFEGKTIERKSIIKQPSDMVALIQSYTIDYALLSPCGTPPFSMTEVIAPYCNQVLTMSRHLNLPIEIGYETPDTLGIDRLALASGGVQFFPQQTLLIIDMGTAITYDIVDENRVLKRGNISPGLKLRFQSLHDATENLPLLSPTLPLETWGKTTHSAILNGVVNGVKGEVLYHIAEAQKDYPEIKVILTGGDSPFFEKLKMSIFVFLDLQANGLNEILLMNV